MMIHPFKSAKGGKDGAFKPHITWLQKVVKNTKSLMTEGLRA